MPALPPRQRGKGVCMRGTAGTRIGENIAASVPMPLHRCRSFPRLRGKAGMGAFARCCSIAVFHPHPDPHP